MGYLIAALVIILAVVVAVAIAEFLIGVLVVAAGIVAALYLWNRLRDDQRRPHPITSTPSQRDRPPS